MKVQKLFIFVFLCVFQHSITAGENQFRLSTLHIEHNNKAGRNGAVHAQASKKLLSQEEKRRNNREKNPVRRS